MFKSIRDILKKLNVLDNKIEINAKEVDKRLDNIEKVLVVQEANLQTHMKRSESLETIVESLQKEEIKPLVKHVNMMEGALKFIGLLGVISGIFGAIAKAFGVM